MEKITALWRRSGKGSRAICTTGSSRSSRTNGISRTLTTTAVALVTASAVLLPGAVQAQTYIGNAYTAKAAASSFLGANALLNAVANVDVGASVFDTGFLNNAVKETRNALGANASLDLSLATSSPLAALGLGNLTDATVTTSQTSSVFTPINPADTAVLSTARVTGLNLASLTGIDALSLLGAYATADVVRSDTSAFLSGNTFGSTTLANFRVNGLTASQLGLQGTVNADGSLTVTEQQTVKIYSSVTLLGDQVIARGLEIGELTINEMIPNSVATGALTTNALHLRLSSGTVVGTLLGNLTGADVIVSSSTAGFTPAASVAAPEPGSLALLMPLLGGVAIVVRRRKK